MFRSLTFGAMALSAAIVLALASFAGILWAYAGQNAGRELVQHTMEV